VKWVQRRSWWFFLLMLSAVVTNDRPVRAGGADALELRATTAARPLRVAGPIPIIVTLTNRSDREVLIAPAFGVLSKSAMGMRAFMLVARDGGASLTFKAVTSPGSPPRVNPVMVDSRELLTREGFERINPGQALEVQLDLSEELKFAEAGHYVIDVMYESRYRGEVDGVWRGRLQFSLALDLVK